MNKESVIIGYSGHAFVVADVLMASDFNCVAYCEEDPKEFNPYNLRYLGFERKEDVLKLLMGMNAFLGIGDNMIRSKVFNYLAANKVNMPVLAHPSAIVSKLAKVGDGTAVMPGVVVNSLAKIGKGVICNTSSVIEHECEIGDFAHIAPGAVIAGNVRIGTHSFVGANATIRQGITVGDNVVIGAGSVVVSNVPDGVTIYGNPAKSRNQ